MLITIAGSSDLLINLFLGVFNISLCSLKNVFDLLQHLAWLIYFRDIVILGNVHSTVNSRSQR